VKELLDRGSRQKERTDQIGVRARLSRNVIRNGLRERGEPGREDRRIVEQRAEQGSLGGSIDPYTDGLAGL
jgi:hypothetical protein